MSERYGANEKNWTGANSPHIFRYFVARGFLEPGETVVDVACGTGYGTNILARSHIERITGIDKDTGSIRSAAQKYASDRIVFQKSDLNKIEDIHYPECDVTVSIETLEHLEDPKRFVELVKRRTKRLIYLTTPIIPTKHGNEFHLHDFNAKIVQTMITDDNWKLFHHFVQGGTYGVFIYYRRKDE